MQIKTCGRCKKVLDISCFVRNKSSKDKLNYECRDCGNERRREYAKRRGDYDKNRVKARRIERRKLIVDYRTDKGCQYCNEKHPSCLQFHHLNQNNKDMNIAAMTNKNIDEIKKEIDKCIILCANCHAKLHYNERQTNERNTYTL